MRWWLVFLGLLGSVYGQDTAWHSTIGTVGNETATRIFETPDGYLMVGTTGYAGQGQSDIYLVRTDENLEPTSFQTIGDWRIQSATDALYDTASKTVVVLCQEYTGSHNFYKLYQLDSAGAVLKTVTSPSTGSQRGVRCVAGSDGFAILVEHFEQDVPFEIHLYNDALKWTKTLPINLDFKHEFVDILIDGDSAVWCLGHGTPFPHLGKEVILSALTFEGEMTNYLRFGGTKTDSASRFYADTSGNFFVVGSSQSFSDSGDFDGWTFKTDREGTMEWQRQDAFTSGIKGKPDYGVDLAFPSENRTLMGMTTHTYGFPPSDFQVYLFNEVGAYLGGQSFGLPGAETLRELIYTSDSFIVAFGEVEGEGSQGPNKNLYCVKLRDVAAVGHLQFDYYADTVSPTAPFGIGNNAEQMLLNLSYHNGRPEVMVSDAGFFQFNLVNSLGQPVISTSKWCDETNSIFDFNSLPSGFYILEAINGVALHRLVVVNP